MTGNPSFKMPASDSFRTVQHPAHGIYKEKGSKFISYIFPIRNENEVKPLIENLQKQHPKSRHICFAYRFGPDPDYCRQHDDGEPNGSAGLPILAQLKSHAIQNALLVVVRYFGGTLLGISGLSAAYKRAASDAIRLSAIKEFTRYAYFTLEHGYPIDKKLKFWINSIEGQIIEQDFSERIQSKVAIPISLGTEFTNRLRKEETDQQWAEPISCQWLASDSF